ncbi:hypothetical protein WM003_02220, partial [Klebsiella michiganensis]
MSNEGLTLNQLAERNAVLVTEVEKLRAERDQLAAENVALKAGIGEAYDEMEQLDDGYFSTDADGEPMDTLITLVDAQAAIQRLAIDIETPATDRIVAGIKASAIPEGFKLVPEQMYLSDEDIQAICMQCGNGDK